MILCALNEERNLPHVLPSIPTWVDETLLIDGHSTDNTIEAAKHLLPGIQVYSQPGKGKGLALKFGVAIAKGDIVVTLDADGTYSSEEIPRFIKTLLDGYDFAKGTRFMGKAPDCMPRNRQLGNKILTMTSNLLYRTHYTDICSGYYAFRKELFSEIRLSSNGFELEQELFVKLAKMKYKVAEVPHSYKERLYGNSKTRDFRQGLKDFLLIVSFIFITQNACMQRIE